LAIAVYAYRQTHSHADYILGGRRFGSTVTAMGVAASDMSAWLMLSLPALFYLFGLNQIWIPLSLFIGSFLNWHMVGPRLRIYTKIAKDSLTIPAYLQNRFLERKQSGIRIISAVVFLIFFTCYAASGFVGTSKLFMATFNLQYEQALWISAPIVVLYTTIGGYLAVNWVDLFQGFLMLTALLLLAIFATTQLEFTQAQSLTEQAINMARYNPFHNLTLIGFFSAIAWGLGYFGQPHILARFMSARSTRDIRIGKMICLSWMFVALICAAVIGLAGYYYFPLGELSSAEVVFPELAELLFHPWFTAIIFAAIISAIMSTVAAVLIGAASSLVEDIYHPIIRPKATTQELIWAGRGMVLLTAIVAFYLATLGDNPSVFTLVTYAWAGLGAAFGPVIILSVYWSRMSYAGAMLGILMGGATTLIWILLRYNTPYEIFNLFGLIPGFIASLIGIIVGSKYWPNKGKRVEKMHAEFMETAKMKMQRPLLGKV